MLSSGGESATDDDDLRVDSGKDYAGMTLRLKQGEGLVRESLLVLHTVGVIDVSQLKHGSVT